MRRRRLIWQLYLSFLVVTLLVLAAVTIYASYTFHKFHLSQVQQQLLTLARVVVPEVEQALASTESGAVDALADRLGRAAEDQVRFTIITPTGLVVGDSQEDPARMESHADRQEVIDALRDGFGHSAHVSLTLGKKMMYLAIPIRQDGRPIAVVRTAMTTTAIDHPLGDIYISVAWAALVIALVAAVLSLLISRGISRPIVRMQRVAQLFARGQLNVRVPGAAAAELDGLARAFNEMGTQLQDRIATITKQRNELEAVLSSMTEGVFAVDSQGAFTSINKAAARLLDIDPLSAQGHGVDETVLDAGLRQFVRDTLRSSEPTEADLSFPGQTERLFHVCGTGLSNSHGEQSGAVIVLSDLTRIHHLENVRRDFVANVSHELKTPVTSIQGFVEALQEGGLADPEQARRYVDIVAKHAQRLNAIIDDLLSLSRLEDRSQRRDISFETTAIKSVLETAIDLSRVKADARSIRIDLVCDEGIEAPLYAPLLEQAVLNLIDNAVKYSEPGSTVEVRAGQTRDESTITVKDNGCGIAPHHLSRLFERFYVVDKSRSRTLGGTGLGLAIVKHIAQVHGGYVTVESALGKGSTFQIHLPRS
ncbi:MAG: HAMP domain-containing protein [Sedimentisphaerales bacterium]|nr:HAMP domain-containing protein [Sedimentisphaerales bacterium]